MHVHPKIWISLYGNYYNVLKWLFMYLNILVNIFACNLLMSISVNFFVIYLMMNISEVLKFQRLSVIRLPPHNPYGRYRHHQCPVWGVWLFSPNDLFCTVFTPLYQFGTWSIDSYYNGWNSLSNEKFVFLFFSCRKLMLQYNKKIVRVLSRELMWSHSSSSVTQTRPYRYLALSS